MFIKKTIIYLTLLYPIFSYAGVYEGQYKYFREEQHIFHDKIPAEVSSINFGYIGSYVDDDYIIRFKTDGGNIRKNLIRKIKLLEQKILNNNHSLSELKYNNLFTDSEKEEEKRVYIQSNNIWQQKIKDYKGALQLLNKNRERYGIKYTGYVVDIDAKRGDIIQRGFPIFTSIDTKIARMKIEVSDEDYNNIYDLKVKRNNTIIKPENIKTGVDEKDNTKKYVYIYLRNPSKYEIDKKYTITIY